MLIISCEIPSNLTLDEKETAKNILSKDSENEKKLEEKIKSGEIKTVKTILEEVVTKQPRYHQEEHSEGTPECVQQ